jgi:Right handed beta helix region
LYFAKGALMQTLTITTPTQLTTAIAQLPTLLCGDDVTLDLAAGEYRLTAPIALNIATTKKLTIAGAGRSQTRLLGSVIKPIVKSPVPAPWLISKPAICTGCHQIYVGGEWRSRSMSEEFVGIRKRLPDGTVTIRLPVGSLQDADLTCRLFYRATKYWRDFIVPIASVTKLLTGEFLLTLNRDGAIDAQRGSAAINFNNSFTIEGLRSRLKNGTWSYDVVAQKISYKPLPKEVTANITTVSIPKLGSIIEVSQSNVTIQNLEVSEGGRWKRIDERGWNSIQAGGVYSHDPARPADSSIFAADYLEPPAGLIQVIDGAKIRILDCDIKNSGTAGIVVLQGQDIQINSCGISDIGDSGITISSCDDFLEDRKVPVDRAVIHANAICRAGRSWRGAPGIQAYMMRDSVLSANTITYCPYSGIAIGWGWTLQNDPELCRNNQIVSNVINNVMQTMLDGGGIYTLGNLTGLYIAYNRLAAIGTGQAETNGRPNQVGIYLDENSRGVLVELNTVEVADGWLNLNGIPAAIEWRINFTPDSSRVWAWDGANYVGAIVATRKYGADGAIA